MMNPLEVERCVSEGRDVLVRLAEMVVRGEQSRSEAYRQARVEHDALVSLLQEAPKSEHGKIHDLLLRYDAMMASLLH